MIRHVAAELGPGHADGQKRKGADDHGGAGDHLHLDGDGDFDVCAVVPLGLSGRADQQVCVAVVAALLGMANAASGILLKWKAQFACAVVWWLARWRRCLGPLRKARIAFLVAIFFCQIVFGIYAMILESRAAEAGGGECLSCRS